MNRRAALVTLPLLAASIVGAIGLGLTPTGRPWFYGLVALAAKTLALLGCSAAAFAFGRGDYLRRAWLLVGMGFLPLLVKDLSPGGGPWIAAGAASWGYLRATCALVGNALSVLGLFLLARTGRIAGIEPPGSPEGRQALLALGTLVAIALVAPGFWSDMHDLRGGDASAMVNIAGDVGDVISFVLIAPVFLTALALRGGSLVWPWALLTLGNLGWLVFDGPPALAVLLHGMTPALKAVGEAARTAACLYYAGAGIAQRSAIR